MTSTRVPALPTNLKERIAALEQKVGNGGTAFRPISPTGSVASNTGTNIPPAGAFRDKIAKFERKGGIPVPRGRFGLGAPPTSQGPQRQGELYGNRIPAPARTVSGIYPSSRATSPTGDSSSQSVVGDRRSFSLSSVISDLDDHADYTPVSSPTFAFPPDSPESTMSLDYSPQTSPSLSTNGDATTFNRNIVRGTSFQKALEIARNAESAKLEVLDPVTPTPRQRSLDEEEELEEPEPTPIIVVSSEDTTPVVVHNSPVLEPQPVPPTLVYDVTEASNIQQLPSEQNSAPQSQPSQEVVKVEIEGASISDVPVPSAPVAEEVTKIETKEILPVIPPTIDVTPLTVRKRRPTLPDPEPPKEPSHEPMSSGNPLPLNPLPLDSVVHDMPPSAEALITVSPPSPVIVGEPDARVHLAPATTNVSRVEEPTTAEPEPEAIKPPKVKIEDEIPSIKLNPPEIVIHDDQPVPKTLETKQDDFNSRKAALALDADLINNELPMSPPLATGMSAMSLTDVLSNYFTGGLATGDNFRNTTPPPLPGASPLSPPATLAYDAPESPPARPRHKVPDMQSFLSPPATGLLSASPSSGGSSLGSLSSLGSRPMSMIETSPSRVTRALRMTPATSRGVPMFLPPNSSRPRKSDFVYFPPTPDAEESEFGSATLHKSSQSLSEGTRRGSEPDLSDPSARPTTTFTAVVHGKVREVPASATMPSNRRYIIPETPQSKRSKRQTYLDPLSPGQGELTALLQEAVWLEDTLNKGELPAESVNQSEADGLERAKLEAIEEEEAAAKVKEEERKRIAYATAQLQIKRDEPTSGKLKHTFLIPLTKARSVHRKEVSTSKTENLPSRAQEDIRHPKSAGVPDKSGARTPKAQPTSGTSHNQRPVTPENPQTAEPGEPTSKSPKSSRFHSFRRLGSISRSNTIHGPSARHSNSTSSEISSEDSQPVVTPPQNNLEFGVMNLEEFGHMSNNSTTSFPSLSPKKSINNLGRAASFAEKMWSRARTKSGGSNLSATSELTVDEVPRLPPFGPPPALNLPSLHSVPLVVPPSPEMKSSKVLQPPKRSTSLKRTANLPPIPTEPVPSLPKMFTPSFHSQAPTDASDISSDSLLLPTSNYSSRPSSWTSLSSAGSLPSPLFDKELFDAFPSVPGTTPMPNFNNFPHRRDNSTSSAVNVNPSFDSALLSSAIHLASSYKSAATPSTTTVNNIMPSRGGTPTPMSRRSGESAR